MKTSISIKVSKGQLRPSTIYQSRFSRVEDWRIYPTNVYIQLLDGSFTLPNCNTSTSIWEDRPLRLLWVLLTYSLTSGAIHCTQRLLFHVSRLCFYIVFIILTDLCTAYSGTFTTQPSYQKQPPRGLTRRYRHVGGRPITKCESSQALGSLGRKAVHQKRVIPAPSPSQSPASQTGINN